MQTIGTIIFVLGMFLFAGATTLASFYISKQNKKWTNMLKGVV